MLANYDEVICPNCITQFRAIPVNVQKELHSQAAEIERLQSVLKVLSVHPMAPALAMKLAREALEAKP